MTSMNDAVLRALQAQMMSVRETATTVPPAVVVAAAAAAEARDADGDGYNASNAVDEQRDARAPPRAPEKVVANACGVCARPVTSHDDRMVRGRCAHVFHASCMVPLIQAGRQFCAECPLARSNNDARSNGGYSMDSGNDAQVRESIATALEYRRQQVRDDLIERAGAGAFVAAVVVALTAAPAAQRVEPLHILP